jgi:hypothetical protein
MDSYNDILRRLMDLYGEQSPFRRYQTNETEEITDRDFVKMFDYDDEDGYASTQPSIANIQNHFDNLEALTTTWTAKIDRYGKNIEMSFNDLVELIDAVKSNVAIIKEQFDRLPAETFVQKEEVENIKKTPEKSRKVVSLIQK